MGTGPVPDGYHTVDPFGHLWTIGTHTEDVPPAEIERRFKAMKHDRA